MEPTTTVQRKKSIKLESMPTMYDIEESDPELDEFNAHLKEMEQYWTGTKLQKPKPAHWPIELSLLKLMFGTMQTLALIKVLIPSNLTIDSDRNSDTILKHTVMLWIMLLLMYTAILFTYVAYIVPQSRKPNWFLTLTTFVLGYKPLFTPMYQPLYANEFVASIICFGGVYLRSWSIHILGRLFTYNVQIAAPQQTQHELISSGPYAKLIHPGYAGLLFACIGYAFFMGMRGKRWLYLVTCVYLSIYLRIMNEEQVLHEHFKDKWDLHVLHKFKLIPYVW